MRSSSHDKNPTPEPPVPRNQNIPFQFGECGCRKLKS
jgi:hypothetical protein